MKAIRWAALAALVFLAGCRCLERHTSEKPKVKNRLTTGLEGSTNLYAEGFGPNRHDARHPSSPYESVSLKWKLEYGVEW